MGCSPAVRDEACSSAAPSKPNFICMPCICETSGVQLATAHPDCRTSENQRIKSNDRSVPERHERWPILASVATNRLSAHNGSHGCFLATLRAADTTKALMSSRSSYFDRNAAGTASRMSSMLARRPDLEVCAMSACLSEPRSRHVHAPRCAVVSGNVILRLRAAMSTASSSATLTYQSVSANADGLPYLWI
jgi:hypothetical protein